MNSRIEELPPADELDDLEAVVWLDLRRLPLGARENFAVAFDGDAISAHLQHFEQGGDGQAIGNVATVSIDDDLHRDSFRESNAWRKAPFNCHFEGGVCPRNLLFPFYTAKNRFLASLEMTTSRVLHTRYADGEAVDGCDLSRERMAKRNSSRSPSALASMTSVKSPLPSGGRGNWMRARP